jgi:dipeptidyl aminopeptidase/acylaminoacyl peptidase
MGSDARPESLHLWNVATGKVIARSTPYDQSVNAVAFSRDGRYFATTGFTSTRNGGDRRQMALWDAATRTELRRMAVHHDWTDAPAFSPDGTLLASFGDSQTDAITLWDVASGRVLGRLPGQPNSVSGLAFSPDGRLLASTTSHDSTIRLWELATREQRLELPGKYGDPALAFSPDGRYLASVGRYDPVVQVWEVATGREALRLEGHQSGVAAVAFSPDGQRLATGSHDTTILVWDLSARLNRKTAKPSGRLAAEREALWQDLTSPDAAAAYRAMRTLVGALHEALAFLDACLKPPAPAHAKHLARLIAALDSEKFAAREQASRELEKVGAAAVPALRRAVAGQPSAERRRRAEALLDTLLPLGPPLETLRLLRVIEILEQIGGGEARRLLRGLTADAWGELVTNEARAALRRLPE